MFHNIGPKHEPCGMPILYLCVMSPRTTFLSSRKLKRIFFRQDADRPVILRVCEIYAGFWDKDYPRQLSDSKEVTRRHEKVEKVGKLRGVSIKSSFTISPGIPSIPAAFLGLILSKTVSISVEEM
ncbi:hypothetical protein CDAR_312601 [Caerostris darwini]|uniref:Uncharacterized protein n=1 Tax=Caerostris darwini TaxID=1538125 RepID=A0AAV4ME47_9ARAC|nr:hypothetical protein CDAR_312601 [Caerostris darwini]